MTTPPSRPTLPWNGEGEALKGAPLLCTEGGEKEPQVGLMKTEDSRPTESDAMVLALTPDEALVVDVTRGLDRRWRSGQRTASSRRRPTVSAITGRKAMLRALYGRECLRYLASAFFCRCSVWGGASG